MDIHANLTDDLNLSFIQKMNLDVKEKNGMQKEKCFFMTKLMMAVDYWGSICTIFTNDQHQHKMKTHKEHKRLKQQHEI